MTTHLSLYNETSGEWLRLRRLHVGQTEVLEIEGGVPPGGDGPPMHVHVDQDEEGVVTSGQLGTTLCGVTRTFGPGERAAFPRGVPHRWWNAGHEPLVFKGLATPAGDLDRFLHGMFAIVNAGGGRPSLFHLAHLLQRHPMQRITTAPVWLERAILATVVAVGRVWRAYPADGWPGSPNRTESAPLADGTLPLSA